MKCLLSRTFLLKSMIVLGFLWSSDFLKASQSHYKEDEENSQPSRNLDIKERIKSRKPLLDVMDNIQESEPKPTKYPEPEDKLALLLDKAPELKAVLQSYNIFTLQNLKELLRNYTGEYSSYWLKVANKLMEFHEDEFIGIAEQLYMAIMRYPDFLVLNNILAYMEYRKIQVNKGNDSFVKNLDQEVTTFIVANRGQLVPWIFTKDIPTSIKTYICVRFGCENYGEPLYFHSIQWFVFAIQFFENPTVPSLYKAITYYRLGKAGIIKSSREWFDDAFKLAEETEDFLTKAYIYNTLGIVGYLSGDHKQDGEWYFMAAEALNNIQGYPELRSAVFQNLAFSYLEKGPGNEHMAKKFLEFCFSYTDSEALKQQINSEFLRLTHLHSLGQKD